MLEKNKIFYEKVLPDDDSYKLIWTSKDKKSHWFQDRSKLIEFVDNNKDQNIYFGLGVTDKKKDHKHRFHAEEVIMIGCAHLDIDILTKALAHKQIKLPATIKEGIEIANSIISPTFITNSGYGLHSYYLFYKQMKIDDFNTWTEFLFQFQQAHFAKYPNYKFDSTFDLSRILRCPGSFNCKDKASPRACDVIHSDENAFYTIEELEDAIEYDANGIQQSTPNIPKNITPSILENKNNIFKPNTLKRWTTKDYNDWFNDQGLSINFKASIDNDMFMEICSAEPKFSEDYRHLSDRGNGTSCSEYDMALANTAIEYGFRNQQVVDIIIMHRRKWSKLTKKTKRPDYYARTILKALSNNEQKKENAKAYQADIKRKNKENGKKGEVHSKEDTEESVSTKALNKKAKEVIKKAKKKKQTLSESEKENIREYLVDKINVYINKIIRYQKTPNEQFDLELVDLPGKIVKLGSFAEGIANQNAFLSKVAATGVETPRNTKRSSWWTDVLPKLRALTVNGVSPETATYEGQVGNWLKEYFVIKNIVPTYKEYLDNNMSAAPFMDNGYAYFTYEEFHNWVRLHKNQLLDFGFMTTMISLGFKEVRKNNGDGIPISLWESPKDFYK